MLTQPSSYDVFLDVANTQPDSVALLTEGKANTTFWELSEQIKANRLALATWGVHRGSRVGLLVPSRDAMVTAYHAVMSCAIAAPLNPLATDDEILFDLADYKVDYLIVEENGDERLFGVAQRAGVDVLRLHSDPSRSGFIHLDQGPNRDATEPDLPLPDDLMVLLHTSGTTAKPKTIPLTQYSRVAETEIPAYRRLLSPSGRCFNAMPLHHRQGLIGEAQSVLMTGSAVFLAKFEPRRFIRQIRESAANWFSLVPSMHQQVVAAAAGKEDIFHGFPLRFCKSTSAALPRALFHDMQRTYGVPVVEAFAAQECSLIAATESDMQLNREGSVGKLARDGIVILNEQGNEVPTAASGEICVKPGPLVIGGYESNPEANAEAFRDGLYHMGDSGYVDEDGYLFLTGRVREIINRGGEKISPMEIDEVLMEHPLIAAAAAFGAPSESMGEEVMAAIVLKPDQQLRPEDIRSFASQKLSFAKVPKRVFIVDDLPLNATGKIVRRELLERLKLDG